MSARQHRNDDQPINQRLYRYVLERDEQRRQEQETRRRRSFEIVGWLFVLGVLVVLIVAGASFLTGF